MSIVGATCEESLSKGALGGHSITCPSVTISLSASQMAHLSLFSALLCQKGAIWDTVIILMWHYHVYNDSFAELLLICHTLNKLHKLQRE